MAFDPKIADKQWNSLLDQLAGQLKIAEPLSKKFDEINQIINQLACESFKNINPQNHQKFVEIQKEINQLASQPNLSESQEKDLVSKLGNICTICKIAERRLAPQLPYRNDLKASVPTNTKPPIELDTKMIMESHQVEVDQSSKAVQSRIEKINELNAFFNEIQNSSDIQFINKKLSELYYRNVGCDYFKTYRLITEFCDFICNMPMPFVIKEDQEVQKMLDDIVKSYHEEVPSDIEVDFKLWDYLFKQMLDERQVGSEESQLKDIRQSLHQFVNYLSLQKSLPKVYEKITEANTELNNALKRPDRTSLNRVLAKVQDAYGSFKNRGPQTGLPTDVLAIILEQAIELSGESRITEFDRLGTISNELEKVAKKPRVVTEELGKWPGLTRFDTELLKRAGKSLQYLVVGNKLDLTVDQLEQLSKICPNIREFEFGVSLDKNQLSKLSELFPKLEGGYFNLAASEEDFKYFIDLHGANLKTLTVNFLFQLKIIADYCPNLRNLNFFPWDSLTDEMPKLLGRLKSIEHLNIRWLPGSSNPDYDSINLNFLIDVFKNSFPNLRSLILGTIPSNELLDLMAKNCPQIKEINIYCDSMSKEDAKKIKSLLPGLEKLKVYIVEKDRYVELLID